MSQEGEMAGLTCCPYLAHGMSFTISEPKVSHIGHSNHLCDMAEKGQISLEQMKALTKDPQFICKKCGRVAHSADNLCEPVPL